MIGCKKKIRTEEILLVLIFTVISIAAVFLGGDGGGVFGRAGVQYFNRDRAVRTDHAGRAGRRAEEGVNTSVEVYRIMSKRKSGNIGSLP